MVQVDRVVSGGLDISSHSEVLTELGIAVGEHSEPSAVRDAPNEVWDRAFWCDGRVGEGSVAPQRLTFAGMQRRRGSNDDLWRVERCVLVARNASRIGWFPCQIEGSSSRYEDRGGEESNDEDLAPCRTQWPTVGGEDSCLVALAQHGVLFGAPSPP